MKYDIHISIEINHKYPDTVVSNINDLIITAINRSYSDCIVQTIESSYEVSTGETQND